MQECEFRVLLDVFMRPLWVVAAAIHSAVIARSVSDEAIQRIKPGSALLAMTKKTAYLTMAEA
ncbi:MAG: hypothetical protein A2103_02770 [Gammaproteobacteria bacterium GWF2_41_13]|nr:MAG: hypothetical protein A2103_02770 [Gammaproteobacteria bacterium GWF2_41_13]